MERVIKRVTRKTSIDEIESLGSSPRRRLQRNAEQQTDRKFIAVKSFNEYDKSNFTTNRMKMEAIYSNKSIARSVGFTVVDKKISNEEDDIKTTSTKASSTSESKTFDEYDPTLFTNNIDYVEKKNDGSKYLRRNFTNRSSTVLLRRSFIENEVKRSVAWDSEAITNTISEPEEENDSQRLQSARNELKNIYLRGVRMCDDSLMKHCDTTIEVREIALNHARDALAHLASCNILGEYDHEDEGSDDSYFIDRDL